MKRQRSVAFNYKSASVLLSIHFLSLRPTSSSLITFNMCHWVFSISLLIVGSFYGVWGCARVQQNSIPLSSQPRITEVFKWRQLDFVFPSPEARSQAIQTGDFVVNNSMVPMGLHASGNRVFLTIPRMRSGVPATLAWVLFPSDDPSPLLNPYPNWELNRQGNCEGLTSVFRVMVDECNRLWIIDNGAVDIFIQLQRICPPKVVVIDLNTDEIIYSFNLPQNVLRDVSLPVTIEVEFPNGSCRNPKDAVVYLADVASFAIIVIDLDTETAWRVEDKTVYPSPEAGTYNIAGETFELMDGVIGIALGPRRSFKERNLYFSASSSFKQRWVKTSILRNQTTATNSPKDFISGIGRRSGQSAGCAMDKNGVLFFGLLNSDTLACWNSKNSFHPRYIGEIARDKRSLQFLATIVVDKSNRLWTISTRFQKFFLNTMNPLETNFRVFMSPSTDDAVRGTVCENSNLQDETNYGILSETTTKPQSKRNSGKTKVFQMNDEADYNSIRAQ